MVSCEAAWLKTLEKQDVGTMWTNYLCIWWTEFLLISFCTVTKKKKKQIAFHNFFSTTVHLPSLESSWVEARICCPNRNPQGISTWLSVGFINTCLQRRREGCILSWQQLWARPREFYKVRSINCIIFVLALPLPGKGCTPGSKVSSSASFQISTKLSLP